MNKRDKIQMVFQALLDAKQCDIDAICIATALFNGLTERKAMECDWVGDKVEKTMGCPECPFVKVELERRGKAT